MGKFQFHESLCGFLYEDGGQKAVQIRASDSDPHGEYLKGKGLVKGLVISRNTLTA